METKTLGTCEECGKAFIKSRSTHIRCSKSCNAKAHARKTGSNSYENSKQRRLLREFNITLEQFNELFASQGECCAICKTTNPGGQGWCVDHDHSCCPGKKSCGECIRGILCFGCNTSLGKFGDSIETLTSAINYLERGKVMF